MLVRGAFSTFIAFVFRISGVIRVILVWLPSHWQLDVANWNFRSLSQIVLRIFSTNAICSILVHFETIIMSSLNECACRNYPMRKSIFWKLSGYLSNQSQNGRSRCPSQLLMRKCIVNLFSTQIVYPGTQIVCPNVFHVLRYFPPAVDQIFSFHFML